MDNISKIIGFSTIVIIFIIILIVDPPIGTAVKETFTPSAAFPTLCLGIHTILGGTVGGCIPFSGAHRLLDAKIYGQQNLNRVTKSSVTGVVIVTVVRVLLFLAVFGVVCVSTSAILDASNPCADAFHLAIGRAGYRLFGLILFVVSIMPSIASPYTSVSFLSSLHPAWLFICTIAAVIVTSVLAVMSLIS